MTKSIKQQIFSVALLGFAFIFMNSCKKEPVHFLCPVYINEFCMPDTNQGYSTYGYSSFSKVYSADIQSKFASNGYTFDVKKIKSARFSSFKIAASNDSSLFTEIVNMEIRIRKEEDRQLGNMVASGWINGDSISSVSLAPTNSDINGIFSDKSFIVLTRVFTPWTGNKAICLQPREVMIDFELDASAKK